MNVDGVRALARAVTGPGRVRFSAPRRGPYELPYRVEDVTALVVRALDGRPPFRVFDAVAAREWYHLKTEMHGGLCSLQVADRLLTGTGRPDLVHALDRVDE